MAYSDLKLTCYYSELTEEGEVCKPDMKRIQKLLANPDTKYIALDFLKDARGMLEAIYEAAVEGKNITELWFM